MKDEKKAADETSQTGTDQAISGGLIDTVGRWWSGVMDAQRVDRLKQCRTLHDLLLRCRQHHQQHPTIKGNKEADSGSGRNGRSSVPYSCYEIDSIPEGIRMMRYFDWKKSPPRSADIGGVLEVVDDDDDDNGDINNNDRYRGQSGVASDTTSSQIASRTDPTQREEIPCIREEHALWACRAIATGCGKDLVELRNCMKEYGTKSILRCRSGYEEHGSAGTTVAVNDTAEKDRIAGDTSHSTPAVPCADLQRKLANCVGVEVRELQQRLKATTDRGA